MSTSNDDVAVFDEAPADPPPPKRMRLVKEGGEEAPAEAAAPQVEFMAPAGEASAVVPAPAGEAPAAFPAPAEEVAAGAVDGMPDMSVVERRLAEAIARAPARRERRPREVWRLAAAQAGRGGGGVPGACGGGAHGARRGGAAPAAGPWTPGKELEYRGTRARGSP